MIKAVIFDLDGVICSTDKYHYLAWKKIADDLEIPFDERVNDQLRGVSRMESLEIILKQRGAEKLYTDEEKEKLAKEKNEYYRELLQNMSAADLSDEVKETLLELRARNYRMAIGSSSKNAVLILEKIGLAGFFDAVTDGTCITRSKPDPEVFLKAAKALGMQPEQCVVVEDAQTGVQAAKAAGMRCAAVGAAAQMGEGDWQMRGLSDLPSILVQ